MGELRLDRWLLPEFEQESDSQIWKIAGPGIRNRIQNFWNKIDVESEKWLRPPLVDSRPKISPR